MGRKGGHVVLSRPLPPPPPQREDPPWEGACSCRTSLQGERGPAPVQTPQPGSAALERRAPEQLAPQAWRAWMQEPLETDSALKGLMHTSCSLSLSSEAVIWKLPGSDSSAGLPLGTEFWGAHSIRGHLSWQFPFRRLSSSYSGELIPLEDTWVDNFHLGEAY